VKERLIVAIDRTDSQRALSELAGLHSEVERRASELAQIHSARLQCRFGCRDCCVDDLTVFEIEAERILREHRELLLSNEPHPKGACAFLDEAGGCRVYASRPYVCRTQGLPLRWIETDVEGQRAEYRDICPLNECAEAPIEGLAEQDCWTIGPTESNLVQLQIEFGGAPHRLRLRDLFDLARRRESCRSDR
jgi:hypothetical protein